MSPDDLPPDPLPDTAGPTALIARRARREVDRIAAQAMATLMLVLGAIIIAGSVAASLDGENQRLLVSRVGFGAVLMVVGVGCQTLLRRDQARMGISLMLVTLLVGLPFLALLTRLGLQSIALAGMALVLTVSGALLSRFATLALAALEACILLVLYLMHQQGHWLLAVAPRSAEVLLVSHGLVAASGLLAGLALGRLFGGALLGALAEGLRLSELVRIGADWTYTLDRRGRLVELSPSFEQHTGHRVAEFMRLGEPDGPQLVDDAGGQALRAAMHARQPFRNIENVFRMPDGSWLARRTNAEPLMDEQGRFLGWWGASHNITQQVQTERDLARARELAEAASQAKSAFLATMSHEIRTPLNGVLGLTRMLHALPPEAGARRSELLALLSESAEGLSGLVSDVLDLARIEAGKLSLNPGDFSLRVLLESAFSGFAALGRERGLTMRLQLDEHLPATVHGDAVRLRQILSNLLHNALKFTHHGSVTLSAEATAPGWLRFELSDTGTGIAPALQARLFQPFEQADGSTTRRHGGSGLGLSICAELATLMAGRIAVESDGHSGSVFRVDLPLATVVLADPPAPAPARTASLDGLCVLVVEDNPVNMLIVCALLQELGARTLEAVDGRQAITMAQAHRAEIDAVLMDLHMPELDGLAATQALRADPATAALPVVALSAAALEADRQRALAAGMRDFLTKPVQPADLLRALAPLPRRAGPPLTDGP